MEGCDGTAVEQQQKLALAAEVFDQFCGATSLRSILALFRQLCQLLQIRPTNFNQFYPQLKSKLRSWKAQALWNKFDKRASHKCYNRGKACQNLRVLVIGAGPCGLRSAIEAQLLGAKVVVVEKRDRITRNNVLHLWPFVIQDLKALGAKKFFGRFCAGAIDHISIRQLQCILLKVSCLLGIEIHEGVGFESLIPPHQDPLTNEKVGWRAATDPPEHPVSQYEFNALIGADGKRNTLDGFKRKEFRGKLAIAITANFINRHSEAEARVEEISGVAFIFNQKFFKELTAETGIDLENIVYYKDDTHYFVMTAKKHSLIDKGVILNDCQDTARLLSPENVDKTALMEYAREAADFSTGGQLPCLEFALNHYGLPDVAMFDFTSMYAAENASRIVEVGGHKLFIALVGDSLLEPFWPTGSGCARGFLSSMDACWVLRSWALGAHPLEVIAERESIYRLLGQTTPENLQRDLQGYTLDPHTRYTNLNTRCVLPVQVRNLFQTEDAEAVEKFLRGPSLGGTLRGEELPKKKRKRECHPETLLHWLKRQTVHYETVPPLEDLTTSFKSGLALCAVLHRYRPHLIDFSSLSAQEVAKNNQIAFDILEREVGIPPVMTGEEMAHCEVPDRLTMLSYLSQVYEAFRGEIPHIKHPKLEDTEEEKEERRTAKKSGGEMRVRTLAGLNSAGKISLLGRLAAGGGHRGPRKRRSHLSAVEKLSTERTEWLEKLEEAREERRREAGARAGEEGSGGGGGSVRGGGGGGGGGRLAELKQLREERSLRQRQIEENRRERLLRRQYLRKVMNEQLMKSMRMLAGNDRQQNNPSSAAAAEQPFEDYSLFVYRQTAPDFKDRVKHLENKLLYPDRENRLLEDLRRGGGAEPDQEFSGRVKELEAKLRGVHSERKPKDLLRAIGKIEKSDWNVKQIEKKMEENRLGRSSKGRSEKVPKWSKEQFEDKFSAVEKKLRAHSNDADLSEKYLEIDEKLRSVEKRIKEGFKLEQGKVSAMAAHLATINSQPQLLISSKTQPAGGGGGTTTTGLLGPPTAAVAVAGATGSEMCHFCTKRVYLMERLSAEGKFFHRSCFKCQYCSVSLRLGNYAFDRSGKFGSRFYCMQHFGLPGSINRQQRLREQHKQQQHLQHSSNTATPRSLSSPPPLAPLETVDVGGTPERAEFENLSDCVEVGEEEWTDRNFGPSATEDERESSSSSSEEGFAEAEDEGGLDPEETLRLAQDWTRKYAAVSTHYSNSEDESGEESGSEEEDEEEDEDEDEKEERGGKAREEGRRRKCRQEDSEDSDTEVPSEDEYSGSSSSEDENSATEISTDSEFEHDGTVHNIPDIVISETVQVKKGHIESPRQVELVSRQMNGKFVPPRRELNLELKRMEEPTPQPPALRAPLAETRPPVVRAPLINPNRGDYLLNRTQSTEGIASKLSLELKKKYLLGSTGIPGSIRKSGSAVTLDTKFKSLIDQISEQQKLLNPAPVPSPTMQAFLQGADKLKTTSPVLLEKKVLPSRDFKHVCSLGEKDSSGQGTEVKVDKKEEEEVRARSPVHETSILVPDLPRKEKDIESDSLSSSELSSTEEEEDEELEDEESAGGSEGENNQSVSPPKLEVHNSRGELMEEDLPLDSLNIPDVCPQPPPADSSPQRDKLDLVPSSEAPPPFTKLITVPSDTTESNGQVLKQVSTPAELFVSTSCLEDGGSAASSPPSLSLKDDITLGLTETELSDWARDEDGVVSESFDDLEYNLNPQNISYKKHYALRNKRNARGAAAKIARTEDFDEDYTHICGKDKPTGLHNIDNLQFMDTADESSDETSSATNGILNRGYIQLVEPEDDDLPTPVVEAINYSCLESSVESKEDLDSSRFGESTDTTTTSEPTTIKDSPIDPQKQNIAAPTPKDFEKVDDRELDSYLARIEDGSGFEHVKSTLDLRKSRKTKSKSPPDSLESTLCGEAPTPSAPAVRPPHTSPPPPPSTGSLQQQEELEVPHSVRLGLNSPATHRKLEQLSQERVKQKDLIHEMVMNRLLVQGKSPTERKARRPLRSSPRVSPLERPKSEVFVTPAAAPSAPPQPQSPVTPASASRSRALTAVSSRRTLLPEETPAPAAAGVASSLPDLHKASTAPPLPSLLTVPNLRGLKEQARAKFKMMSDEELGLSPEDKIKKFKLKIQKHLQEAKLPPPTHIDKIEVNKKTKEERKKSIIQAVSDFFHKKSPSSSKSSSSQRTQPPPASSSTSASAPSSPSKKDDTDAPPIPPPPLSYNPSQDVAVAGESCGGSEEEESSCWTGATRSAGAGSEGSLLPLDSLQRKDKLSRRLVRQAQSKRLRMAQEVQRELELLEVRQKELEAKGVEIEKALRGEESSMSGGEKELLGDWLSLSRELSQTRRKERQLLIRGQEIELEHRHARLQAQLASLMAVSATDGGKTSEEVALEARILREMLEIVERRNSLGSQLEADKQRFSEEEKDLESQMLARGIQLSHQQPQQT